MAGQGQDSKEPWDLAVDAQVVQVRRVRPGSTRQWTHRVRGEAESLGQFRTGPGFQDKAYKREGPSHHPEFLHGCCVHGRPSPGPSGGLWTGQTASAKDPSRKDTS